MIMEFPTTFMDGDGPEYIPSVRTLYLTYLLKWVARSERSERWKEWNPGISLKVDRDAKKVW